jgi:hypothetical protein
MKLANKIFQQHIEHYTTPATRERWNDSVVNNLVVSPSRITAKVRDGANYAVEILYAVEKVTKSTCTCGFDQGPVCPHIVHVLIAADREQLSKYEKVLDGEDGAEGMIHPTDYVVTDFHMSQLTNTFLFRHSSEVFTTNRSGFRDIHPETIALNEGTFTYSYGYVEFPIVSVKLKSDKLIISCPCKTPKKLLCQHQVQVLFNLMDRQEIRMFFDENMRHAKMRQFAVEYGLDQQIDPDDYFELHYTNRTAEIRPKMRELLPVNKDTTDFLTKTLLPKAAKPMPGSDVQTITTKQVIVFGQHKYYDHFYIELMEAQAGKEGKLKNPLKSIHPLDLIWKTEKVEELKFYTGISKFHNSYQGNRSESDIEGLKALVRNPLELQAYYLNTKVSENITASSIVPVELRLLNIEVHISVHLEDGFYEMTGELILNDTPYPLKNLKIRYDYFVLISGTMYLIDNPDFLRVIRFFQQNNHRILIYESKFAEFRENILSQLENKVRITYTYLRPATKKQLKQQGFDKAYQPVIYLSEHGNYIWITPVMRYGNVEIPVLSRKQVYATDKDGNAFTVNRDEERELALTATLLKQHPDFEEQLDGVHLYLHRQRFIDEGWFLEAFETWRDLGIEILGFSELKHNNLNQNKAKITVSVSRGLDWFDTMAEVKFGHQQVSLKQVQKAVWNKSKFIQLGDGTLGILPEEWMVKFDHYFRAGELAGEHIRTPRMNFAEINALYEDEVLTSDVKDLLALYAEKVNRFETIEAVEVPEGLEATLRDYQKQGLNWLNFLDEFGFGGCLADDMGLGKTIQIIAFILSQKEKGHEPTNLIVVPTSLIFNWQEEVAKFAPSLRMHTIYGIDRVKNTADFDQYDIVLTSYGTMLSDVRFLKEYVFNYIILDESQVIKNPESQRYKAVRLLQSRNKLVLTGTPVENNTFDLYGQLSFACPGLLGTKQRFKDVYVTPIDKFEDSRRARELQQKINPFILRRTKQQVAKELPEKTEMVIYCEMGEEQRKVYDSYKKEFQDFLMSRPPEELQQESMHILQGLTKLRQICNSPALLSDEAYYGDASAKIEVLIEQIESKAPQHKILVFSQFVTMLDLIKKELEARDIKFSYLTGKTRDRAAKVNEFQQNDDVRVFLISLKAGGTGLNLTEADYVYLVDPWWNPAVENQAIDRSYRIGQQKNVVAVRLICPDTIEEKIMKLQESKKALVNELIKTDTSILKSLSRESLLSLFD